MLKNNSLLRLFFLILFLTFPVMSLVGAEVEIKSLKIYQSGEENSFPVIVNGSGSLTIEFDVKAGYEPSFRIIFKFCDRNWNPYNNTFLANNGYNTVYQSQIIFNTFPVTISEADYHFKESFPNNKFYIDFPFSGKWKFYITEASDTSIVYAQGKFFVVNDLVDIFPKIKNETLEKIFFSTDLNKVYKLSLDFDLPLGYYAGNVQGIEIVENQKIDYPFIVDRNGNNDDHAFYWNGSSKFSFMTKEIRPGNSYRQTDLRNTTINMAKQVNAQFDGVENSRFFISPQSDLWGSSIIPAYSEDFSTYLNVKFRLRSIPEINGSVFVVGAFNNWRVLPEYEMELNDGTYIKTIELKRGIYDYQYVTAENNNGKISNIDWCVLEGNNWDCKKKYYVFLWYSEPDKGGYDRIIGYKQIVSN